MNAPLSNWSIDFSQRIYERLLAAYPRSHREEYGSLMTQLFRDQCRDAWNEERAWGVTVLWLRILPDLVKTSFMERFTSMNPGKFMSNTVSTLLHLRRGPKFAFFATFAAVFLFVFGMSVVVTWLLPETYGSTVRLKVEPEAMDETQMNASASGSMVFSDPFFIQTTFEIIQSQVVLSNVVDRLNLNKTWGRKYYGGETLKTAESVDILRNRLELRPIRGTTMIAITAYSDDRMEAAQLANAVAEAYQQYRLAMRRQLTASGLKALEKQYADYEAQIQDSATKLDTLRAQLGIIDMDPNALAPTPALSQQQLQAYDQQIIEGGRVYEQLRAQLNRMKAMDKNHLREALPTLTGDSMLPDLLSKLSSTEQSYAVETNEYAMNNAHVTRLQAMMSELNSQIDSRIIGVMDGLQSETDARKAALDALQASVEKAKAADRDMETREWPYWEEKRKLARLLDFHKILAAKIEEEKLELEIPKDSLVQITDTAEPGNAPVKPNKPLNILIGFVAGVLCGSVAGLIAAILSARWTRRRSGLAMSATA